MSSIKIITWNIWFHENGREKRTIKILEEILRYDADFIVFQEVTPDSSQIINRMKQNYHIIGYPLMQSYDTLMLSRYLPSSWNRYQLPDTQMGRNLLLAEFLGPTIQIGTFHLESIFPSNILKVKQLEYIREITSQNTILLGDTNFTSPVKISGLIDIFEYINEPKAYEYTYCGMTNRNIKRRNLKSRLDRIYVKSIGRVSSFYLIGTDATYYDEKRNNYYHPSDHYGVISEFTLI